MYHIHVGTAHKQVAGLYAGKPPVSPKSATDRSDCTIEPSSGTQRIVSEEVSDLCNSLSVVVVRETSDSMTAARVLHKRASGRLRNRIGMARDRGKWSSIGDFNDREIVRAAACETK